MPVGYFRHKGDDDDAHTERKYGAVEMPYRPGKGIISEQLETRSAQEIANLLGVDVAHIYNVERRGVGPTLHKALVKAGWVSKPKKEIRICATVSEKERQALRRMVRVWGYDSFTDWCRDTARAFMKWEKDNE